MTHWDFYLSAVWNTTLSSANVKQFQLIPGRKKRGVIKSMNQVKHNIVLLITSKPLSEFLKRSRRFTLNIMFHSAQLTLTSTCRFLFKSMKRASASLAPHLELFRGFCKNIHSSFWCFPNLSVATLNGYYQLTHIHTDLRCSCAQLYRAPTPDTAATPLDPAISWTLPLHAVAFLSSETHKWEHPNPYPPNGTFGCRIIRKDFLQSSLGWKMRVGRPHIFATTARGGRGRWRRGGARVTCSVVRCPT